MVYSMNWKYERFTGLTLLKVQMDLDKGDKSFNGRNKYSRLEENKS